MLLNILYDARTARWTLYVIPNEIRSGYIIIDVCLQIIYYNTVK